MTNPLINEKQLQAQIDELKTQFPDTQDAYREACVILFFRYGITPTANKLYQYVRKGSMSAPAEALNKFWTELRDKSRVRIERADIPENIGTAAGEFVAKLWADAQKAAQDGFFELINNSTSEVLKYKLEAEISKQELENIHTQLANTQTELKNALILISESDYLLSSNTQALAASEKSLISLENDKRELLEKISTLKLSFSMDLDLINKSLQKAEIRYESLERKTLIETDQSRQQLKKLTKEIQLSHKTNIKIEQLHKKDLSKYQSIINNLHETHGLIKGKLVVEKQLHEASKKLLNKSKNGRANK